MKLYIKNMVCPRCITAVKVQLEELNISFKTIDLGEVELESETLDEEVKAKFAKNISEIGFELIDDGGSRIVEKIKTLVIDYVHYKEENLKIKFSEYLKTELNYSYSYLSNLFASVEGSTIEQYVINHKIESVKELLFYEELSLNEISYKLGYSSVAHLSAQFKKATGMTPSAFKKLRDVKRRTRLDNI